MAEQKYQLVLAETEGHLHVRAIEQTLALDSNEEDEGMRLGTQELLSVAEDALACGFRIRNVALVDRRFTPLDDEDSQTYVPILLSRIRMGKRQALKNFFSREGRGLFISNIEFESPHRSLLRLERRGVLRADPAAKVEFLPVIEAGLGNSRVD